MREGLVERRPHPRDRRANLLYLTDKGRQVLVRMAPLGQEIAADVFEALDEADIEALLVKLLRIKHNIRRAALAWNGSKVLRHGS